MYCADIYIRYRTNKTGDKVVCNELKYDAGKIFRMTYSFSSIEHVRC